MISLSRRPVYFETRSACDEIRARYIGYKWFHSKTSHFVPPRPAPTLLQADLDEFEEMLVAMLQEGEVETEVELEEELVTQALKTPHIRWRSSFGGWCRPGWDKM